MSEIKVVKVSFVITNKEFRPKKSPPSDRKQSSPRETFDHDSTWLGLSFEDNAIKTGLSRDWLVTCEDSLHSRKKK